MVIKKTVPAAMFSLLLIAPVVPSICIADPEAKSVEMPEIETPEVNPPEVKRPEKDPTDLGPAIKEAETDRENAKEDYEKNK